MQKIDWLLMIKILWRYHYYFYNLTFWCRPRLKASCPQVVLLNWKWCTSPWILAWFSHRFVTMIGSVLVHWQCSSVNETDSVFSDDGFFGSYRIRIIIATNSRINSKMCILNLSILLHSILLWIVYKCIKLCFVSIKCCCFLPFNINDH